MFNASIGSTGRRIKAVIRSAYSNFRDVEVMRRRLHTMAVIERERYIKEILSDDKYKDKKRLSSFGFKVYSQQEEDGIIAEIFSRIGTSSKIFVEFGVEDGLENNTLRLLLEGWTGLWLEGSQDHVNRIRTKFSDVIEQGRLRAEQAFITRENINQLLSQNGITEIDLISIDIDGNDIYVLEALENIKPRLIVVEYNAKFPPPMNVAQVYNASHQWRGGDYYGASLVAIDKVARKKGYSLVGCDVTGVNAFYVRNDLLGDKFCPPYSPENHFEPARYFLWQTFVAGHEPDWGPYTQI